MSFGDQFVLALCAWRENRHGQEPGMQSVMNVIVNRVAKNSSSVYAEAVKFEQFSSITAPSDPQLAIWPSENDPQWLLAQALSTKALSNVLPDITGGALSYVAVSLEPKPRWCSLMTETATIAGQVFFK